MRKFRRPHLAQTQRVGIFALLVCSLLVACDRFSSSGSLGAPDSECAEDMVLSNAVRCLVKADRYVTANNGSDLISWTNPTGSNTVSAAIPTGFYKDKTISFTDPQLVSGNIKSGVSIFNVPGYYTGNIAAVPDLRSTMHHAPGVTQLTQQQESSTNSGQAYPNDPNGYHAVPKFDKDLNVISGAFVDRTGWDTTCDSTTGAGGGSADSTCTCGLSGTLEARIADCAAHSVIGAGATWDGRVRGNAGQGVWKLVTRTADIDSHSSRGTEVWRDESTQLLWSAIVSWSLSWCKASGSNNIPGNPAAEDDPADFCDLADSNIGFQEKTGKAISACFEDGEVNFTSIDVSIWTPGKGGLGRSSSPRVDWRLPTIYDYAQAYNNGYAYVNRDFNEPGSFEWTATLLNYQEVWSADNHYFVGKGSPQSRNSAIAVRCVGR